MRNFGKICDLPSFRNSQLFQKLLVLVYMKYNAFSERRKRERVSKKDGDWRRKDEKKQLKDDQAKKEKMRATENL